MVDHRKRRKSIDNRTISGKGKDEKTTKNEQKDVGKIEESGSVNLDVSRGICGRRGSILLLSVTGRCLDDRTEIIVSHGFLGGQTLLKAQSLVL